MATGFPIIFQRPLWTPSLAATAVWLDAADAATITLNGSTVSQWDDKSGNRRNVTQSVAVYQPAYNATAINGLPAVYFSTNTIMTGSAPLTSCNEFSLFLVHEEVSRVTPTTWRLNSEAAGRVTTHIMWSDGKFYFDCGGSTGANRLAANSPIGTTPVGINQWAYRNTVSGGIKDVAVNGNSPFASGTGTTAGCDLLEFNTGGTGDFRIAEFVVFAQDVPQTTRQRTEGYLAWKWGLVGNLPSTHPYKNSPPRQ